MRGFRIPFFLVIVTLVSGSPADQHGRYRPSAMLTGTVLCDTCFSQNFSSTTHFISGATVAIECGDGNKRYYFRREVQTDRYGGFRIELPFSVKYQARRIKRCSLVLVRSSDPYCSAASIATSSLKLKSRNPGLHIFSAGFFTFRPLQQPELCYQKPALTDSNYPAFYIPYSPNTPSVSENRPWFLPSLPNLPPLPPLTISPLINIGPPQLSKPPAIPQEQPTNSAPPILTLSPLINITPPLSDSPKQESNSPANPSIFISSPSFSLTNKPPNSFEPPPAPPPPNPFQPPPVFNNPRPRLPFPPIVGFPRPTPFFNSPPSFSPTSPSPRTASVPPATPSQTEPEDARIHN